MKFKVNSLIDGEDGDMKYQVVVVVILNRCLSNNRFVSVCGWKLWPIMSQQFKLGSLFNSVNIVLVYQTTKNLSFC